MNRFILDDNHNVVPCNYDNWLAWMKNPQNKRVALTETYNGYRVSTVFLTADHGFGGQPKWFETMIFDGNDNSDLYCERYTTWTEAIEGHAKAVAMAEKGEPFDV